MENEYKCVSLNSDKEKNGSMTELREMETSRPFHHGYS